MVMKRVAAPLGAALVSLLALGPAGSAVAGGSDVLVAGLESRSVLRYGTDGFLGSFAGEALAAPTDIEIGPDGDLYVTDAALHAVLRFDGGTGEFKGYFVEPGAGGLASPQSLVFGPDGYLYVTGTPDTTVVRYDGKTGGFINIVLALGSTVPGQVLFGPDGMLYYVCQTCKNVKQIDPQTDALLGVVIFNTPDTPLVPRGMAFDMGGYAYLTRAGDYDSVLKYDSKTWALVGTFSEGGGIDDPYDIIFADGVMYVSGKASSSVAAFDAGTGAFLQEVATTGEGGLAAATGLAMVGSCYADFNRDGALSLFDFLAFVNSFNGGDAAADCDQGGTLNLFDFLCFANLFNAGC